MVKRYEGKLVFYSHPSLIWQLPESFTIAAVSVALTGTSDCPSLTPEIQRSVRDTMVLGESGGSFTEIGTLDRPAICPKPLNPPPVNSHTEASVLQRDWDCVCVCVYKRRIKNRWINRKRHESMWMRKQKRKLRRKRRVWRCEGFIGKMRNRQTGI